jgi:hypothetical protein
VTESFQGLRVLDLTNPAAPEPVGLVNRIGMVDNVAILGTSAFLACGFSGLRAADISNPSTPREIAVIDTGTSIRDIALLGNYAYTLECEGALNVLSVANPSAIIPITRRPILPMACYAPFSESLNHIRRIGNYAYIMGDGVGFTIFDLSNPEAPQEILHQGFRGYDIAVYGHYAYLASYANGVRILDITDPAVPLEAGMRQTTGLAMALAISGHYAFIADEIGDLRVFDISFQPLPEPVGHLNFPGYAYGVDISGDYAFIAAGEEGLYVVNISNPRLPVLTGHYNTPGYALRVTAEGSTAYVSDGIEFGIYDCSAAMATPAAEAPIPVTFSLSAFPNPFNAATTIRYSLPVPGRTSVSVYDVMGRQIRSQADEIQTAGLHDVRFDGADLASGIYFIRLETAAGTLQQKMVLLK